MKLTKTGTRIAKSMTAEISPVSKLLEFMEMLESVGKEAEYEELEDQFGREVLRKAIHKGYVEEPKYE